MKVEYSTRVYIGVWNEEIVILGAILGILSACTSSNPEAARKQHLKAKSDAVSVKFTDPALAKTVVGFRAVNFTTKRPDANETVGAPLGGGRGGTVPCQVVSDGYSAEFSTPAVVNMPSFGRYTQNAKLTCTYNDREFSKVLKPRNPSASSRTGAAVAVGVLLCSACGGAMLVDSGKTREEDVFVFSDVELKLR